MKTKQIILTLTLSVLSLCTIQLYGQENGEVSKREQSRIDSLEMYKKTQAQEQKVNDEARMDNVKNASRQTKANAKEAQRVEREATDASRESKNALKAEKRAQRSRKQADRQAQKAADARTKSNRN